MKFAVAKLLALGLWSLPALGKMHYDWEKIEIGEIDSDTRFSDDGTEIFFKQRPGSRVETPLRCDKTQGYQLTFTKDKKFVACCLPGQVLVGSPETAFDCCGEGHDMAGSEAVGFECCPTGHKWDGKVCKSCEPEPPKCSNGRILVDGQCVCPEGQVPVSDGGCGPDPNQHHKPACDPPRRLLGGKCVCPAGTTDDGTGGCVRGCSSGLSSGKCYTFTFENGYRFGYNHAGWYTATKESRIQQFGKFKLCVDEQCSSGSPINPGTGFAIKDIHGLANGGQRANEWLNNAQNGGHIGKTPKYEQSGKFTLTKWPCGKYCLGGLDAGIGPTCPSESPAATFTTHDPQSCLPIEVTEVPCDVRAMENNCIWTNGADQCCDKMSCAGVGATDDFAALTVQI